MTEIKYNPLGNVSLLDYIKNLKNLKLGKKINHPEAIYFETEKIEISLVKWLHVADGEYLHQEPKHFSFA
jgi:diacylglycerol kinase family enzyme